MVATSLAWQTSCVLVRRGEEAFCVDSVVFPDELAALPAVASQAGFKVLGLLATHADWDHVLGPYAFPDAALGVAESSVPRLRDGSAQRALREFDDEWYVSRDSPLSLGDVQALPVPGRVGIGDSDLELVSAPGHTDDGMAVWVPWARVLICGDYLSPVEIPMVGGGVADYLATLLRFEEVVERADWVVPGHGAPLSGERALAILREDRAYVSGLPDAPLPLARRSAAQRKIHERNVSGL